MAAAAFPFIDDLVHETSTTTGTGNFTLANYNGKQSFNGAFSNGATTDVFYYYISNRDVASEREYGTGHMSAAATLVRDTIIGGSNGTSAVNFSAGTKDVVCDFLAGYQFASAKHYGLVNHSLAVSAASSALTISLKDAGGSDPSSQSRVVGYFRNVTGTSGVWTKLEVTGALSLVVSSGSTLGVTSATAFRLWVVLFNDGGTARLGVVNCLLGTPTAPTGIFALTENIPASATSEGGAGAADSAGVIYAGATITSKSFLIVGYVEWNSTGLTAGTWTTTNVNFVQTFEAGVKRPGEFIQSSYQTTTTQTSTTSSSFQSTNSTLSHTPKSACNLLKSIVAGHFENSSGSTVGTQAQIHRDSTAIGSIGVTYSQSGGDAVSSLALLALDVPNTTSAVTIVVKVKSNGTNNVNWQAGTGNVCALLVEEYMT